VSSTSTGGIPELLSAGAGIIVEERNSRQLAEAIERLFKNNTSALEIGEKGFARIQDQFCIETNAAQLLGWMAKERLCG